MSFRPNSDGAPENRSVTACANRFPYRRCWLWVAVVSLFWTLALSTLADAENWGLQPVTTSLHTTVEEPGPMNFGLEDDQAKQKYRLFSLWEAERSEWGPTIDFTVAPAKFAQPAGEELMPQPSFLRPEEGGEQLPRPSFLDPNEEELPLDVQVDRLSQRLQQLETSRLAQEDATRSIIRQSFAEQGSNINDVVVFGGTLETLTFWADDFNGVDESDIVLDTAEIDFEIQMNTWSRASLVFEYFDGTNIAFPTAEEDEVFIDRINVRQAFITIGDTTRYPLFITTGRDVIPFGISTGDPVTDVLTIVDPLTVEVFETTEDFFLIGFAGPVPPPPPPVSPGSPPALAPPRPMLINPLARRLATSVCTYCGPPTPAEAIPPYVPPLCVAPYSGAIYFYNGETLEEINQENHIEQMGGTLGYFTRGVVGRSAIPWTLDCDVDVNSSVFDSDFLQFEYRHFLDQIGYVPGMAAHVKSNIGPVGLVVEWNGAINDADFIDDALDPVSIRPEAWQISLAYQFDWNREVEVIGMQGTYFVVGYSESSDLAGVTRIFAADPLNPLRVGNVPERRFSVGVGEWVLEGLRVAFEYSHAIDYDEDEGGTGETADGVFMQITYEW